MPRPGRSGTTERPSMKGLACLSIRNGRRPERKREGRTAMRRVAFLAVAALTGIASSAYGQGSDLEQKVRGQYTLTKVTADRSDITAAGTVVELRKDGLWTYSSGSPVPYVNKYDEKGRIVQPFVANLGVGILGGVSSNNTNYPSHRFTAGEKFSIIRLFFPNNGITFLLYSNPYMGTRYYCQLTFPFKKGSDPAPDEVLARIAEVLAQPGAATEVAAKGGAPLNTPPTVASQPARLPLLPATFVNTQTPADQLQLNADSSFSLQEGGQAYPGSFAVNGRNLEITITDTGIKTPLKIQGNNLTGPGGETWALREQSSPAPSSEGALRNGDVLKMAKADFDDAFIIAKIGSSKCQFDTSTDALIQLKKSGVSAAVLKAMVGAGK